MRAYVLRTSLPVRCAVYCVTRGLPLHFNGPELYGRTLSFTAAVLECVVLQVGHLGAAQLGALRPALLRCARAGEFEPQSLSIVASALGKVRSAGATLVTVGGSEPLLCTCPEVIP